MHSTCPYSTVPQAFGRDSVAKRGTESLVAVCSEASTLNPLKYASSFPFWDAASCRVRAAHADFSSASCARSAINSPCEERGSGPPRRGVDRPRDGSSWHRCRTRCARLCEPRQLGWTFAAFSTSQKSMRRRDRTGWFPNGGQALRRWTFNSARKKKHSNPRFSVKVPHDLPHCRRKKDVGNCRKMILETVTNRWYRLNHSKFNARSFAVSGG